MRAGVKEDITRTRNVPLVTSDRNEVSAHWLMVGGATDVAVVVLEVDMFADSTAMDSVPLDVLLCCSSPAELTSACANETVSSAVVGMWRGRGGVG